MEIISWHIDPILKKELDNHYQARKSYKMRSKLPKEVIAMYTFSYGAPQLTMEKASEFMDFIEKLIGKPIEGVGLEVGSGPGTHSALLAKRKGVRRVYAVEASEPIVRNLTPIVIPFVAGNNEEKIVPVVGEFNNLEVPDDSVDFVFDFFSLHHSPDLSETVKEIYRVLKPGGFLFCLDKARDDRMSEEDLEKLLNTEYSPEFKKEMGIAPSETHTRRMNGENEYRLKDWLSFFKQAGFRELKHYNIARTTSSKAVVRVFKEILSVFPPKIQVRITSILPSKPTNNISPNNRTYSKLVNLYQKEISLLIAYK